MYKEKLLVGELLSRLVAVLVEEVSHAVLLVLGSEALCENVALELQSGVQVNLLADIDSFLNERNSNRSLSCDLLSELYSLVNEVLERINVVYKTHVQSVLSGVVAACGVEHFLSLAHAYEASQTLGAAAARGDAQTNFRLAEGSVLGSKTDVAGHSQLAAAAEAEAVDCSDDRALEVLDLPAYAVGLVAEQLAFLAGLGSHLGDVSACNEGVNGLALLVDGGRTGQNDSVNVVQILSQLVECFLALSLHIGGQCVHSLHMLDLNDRYMALFFDYYVSHF